MTVRPRRRPVLAVIAVLLLLAACVEGTEDPTTTTTAVASSTTLDMATRSDRPTGTYRVGMIIDVATDNFWAVMGPAANAYDSYASYQTHPALFGYTWDWSALAPDLAADVPVAAVLEGDVWVIEQKIRPGYFWSDGVEVTARDLVFTYETVRDFGMEDDGNLSTSFPLYSPAQVDDPSTPEDETRAEQQGVTSVSAPDPYTVRIEFSSEPGLSVWPYGIGAAFWMPEHFWVSLVEGARQADDPAEALYGASGVGEPSAGLMVRLDREPGAYVHNQTNPDAYYAYTRYDVYGDGSFRQHNDRRGFDECYLGECTGSSVRNYEIGPFVDDVILSIYSDANAAVIALAANEIDYYLNPIGLATGLKDQIQANPDLHLIANPSNGWRYLAFNMRKAPGKYKGFRKAIGCVTDKEFMQTLLQGAALPGYSLVPASNTRWANPDVEQLCKGLSAEERFERAVAYLKDPSLNDGGSFTWAIEPVWDPDNTKLQAGTGTGLRDPQGDLVPDLELLAPGPGYDPLRSTYAVWIAEWASNLGIPLHANPTGFSVISEKVWGDPTGWDMYILGWGLGAPAFPTFHEAFFASWQDAAQGGFNTPGYFNERVDELATELLETTEVGTAQALVRELDQIIVDDAPYVVLFSTPVLEAFRSDMIFPFTEVLAGIQGFAGFPEAVRTIN